MLEISKVSYSYSGNSVFSDVSLNVAPGSFYFLTGPSGSGKTTFINLCAGALIPEIGSINVFGKDTQTMTSYDLSKMRQRLGIVHQNCEFLDHLSIEENIALLNEKTFSLVKAIPKDIKIRNIVAYINRKVVFSTNPGSSKS